MRVRIESGHARRYNETRRPGEPGVSATWQGEVPDMGLEDLFRFFNRVDHGDAERLDALGFDLPSMSVGDTVAFNGRTFLVEPIGFTELGVLA